jgi:hypothetical protein
VLVGGRERDALGVYARSMPAENTLSFAEDRTTTRTVGSSAIQSKAAPYSRQNLTQRKKDTCKLAPRSRARAHHSLFIECVDGWPKWRSIDEFGRERTNYGVLVNARGSRKTNEPVELDVEHVLGRKAQSEMLESRGV